MIRLNGPPRDYWCMTFERANAVIKAPTKNSHNFTDPYLTIANRKQDLELANILKTSCIRDEVITRGSFEVLVADLINTKN